MHSICICILSIRDIDSVFRELASPITYHHPPIIRVIDGVLSIRRRLASLRTFLDLGPSVYARSLSRRRIEVNLLKINSRILDPFVHLTLFFFSFRTGFLSLPNYIPCTRQFLSSLVSFPKIKFHILEDIIMNFFSVVRCV